jgi:uncharacterized 2Fe-2S/4Fe-4S cluster protein (DUF4445 family)
VNKQDKYIKINILPENYKIIYKADQPLMQIIEKNDLPVYQPCGGNATCGKCLIRFLSGAPEPTYNDRLFLTPEELEKGFRLSCQCVLHEDAVIEIPEFPDDLIVSDHLELQNPLVNLKKIDAEQPNRSTMGIAIDVGSTTLAVCLMDMRTGHTYAIDLALNPQSKFGDDLITRINYIIKNIGAEKKLHKILIEKLNSQIKKICQSADIRPDRIDAVVVSGNAVMNHLFLEINPKNLGFAPFKPEFYQMKEVMARKVGLAIKPQASVYVMPNIGGYVGGDIVSDMLCAGFGKQDRKIKLLIDIGTNCEVVLEHPDGRLATSSPAGPALEGSCIRFGMRAESGAIFDIDESGNVLTIKNKPVRGICGSGLFHLIDAFYTAGLIKASGLIEDDKINSRHVIREFESQKAILLDSEESQSAREVYLTQADVREFQLARAAIIAAWKMLCDQAGIKTMDIDDIYIAGAFGNFIRPEAAIKLGLVPLREINKIHLIGNGSLEGGRLILTNADLLVRASSLAETTQFVELGGKPEFQEVFVENMTLPTLP